MAGNFEYEQIKSKLNTIKDYYTEYINAVNSIDLSLKTELDVSSNSALFNAQGNKVIELWNNNSDCLKNFKYVFEKWLKDTINKYNDIIKNKEGLGDNLKITDNNLLSINPNTYTDSQIDTLSKLLSGDSSIKGKVNRKGNESIKIGNRFYKIIRDNDNRIIKIVIDDNITVIHHSLYETLMRETYDKYNNKELSEEEWNSYLKNLTSEEKAYLDILSTNALIVNTTDIVSLLCNNENE